jgi:leucyl aminopeptidase
MPYQAGETADLLCLPVFEGETPCSAGFPEFSGVMEQAGRFPKDPGKKGSIRVVPVKNASVKALLLAGLGKRPASAAATANVYRNRIAECVRHAVSLGFVSLIAQLPDAPDFHISRAAAEGAILGNYVFRTYWTTDAHPEKTDIETFALVGADPDGLDRGVLFGEAQAFARDLVNEPGNIVNPLTLAGRAMDIAKENDLECTVFDEDDILKMGMNALLSVGQGSRTPPRLIHLVYRPETPSSRRIALVGKTVTFDSGGLCIKTRDGIKTMKTDKTGGCNVLAIMRALGRLRPDVEVHGILGAVENMPDGNSYRPDDIIRTMSGKTIEILNTDAEGRVTLADVLTYACRVRPDALVDMATLTGAVVTALGNYTAALVSDHDGLSADLLAAAERSGERFHRFTMDDDKLREKIASQNADFTNSGGPGGGVITAGMLLREFVDADIPWAHLDIAAVAHYDKEFDCYGTGGSAYALRTCLEYVLAR